MSIHRLTWDSSFWGIEVGQLAAGEEKPVVDNRLLDRFDVIQTRVALTDYHIARHLSRLGFFPVDTRVEYEISLHAVTSRTGDECMRKLPPDPIDEHFADRMCQLFLPCSRFNAFPVDQVAVSRFYKTWMKKSMTGNFDDETYILSRNGQSAGFFSITYKNPLAQIGLFAVHPDHQGNGISQILLNHAREVSARVGCTALRVVTEGRNITARRAYLRHGFVLLNEDLWMYRTHDRYPV